MTHTGAQSAGVTHAISSRVELALRAMASSLPSDAIRTDDATRERHAHDESETPPTIPDAVVVVRSRAEVAQVMRAAHAHDVFVTPRSGGTGRTGGAVPVGGGIVMAFEHMDAIVDIDETDLRARVQPGVITRAVHDAVEARGLFYPPDPNSLESCRLGGNVAENAGGPRAFKYGVTREYVLGLDVVLPDGTELFLGKNTPKGVTGYDLASLVVGSEGTLALVTEIVLGLVPKLSSVATMLVLLAETRDVSAAVSTATRLRLVPRCIEMLDHHTLALIRGKVATPIPENARAALIVELDGDEAQVATDLERLGNGFVEMGALDVLIAQGGSQRESLWAARREMSYALRRTSKLKLSEDIVVPRSKIAELLARVDVISSQHQIRMPTYGHAGDGNLHVNFLWDDASERPRVDAAIEALFRATVELSGTLSGEHGIGVLKAPYLPLEQPPALIALQERVKDVFDPKGILNPGKIFPAHAARFHRAC